MLDSYHNRMAAVLVHHLPFARGGPCPRDVLLPCASHSAAFIDKQRNSPILNTRSCLAGEAHGCWIKLDGGALSTQHIGGCSGLAMGAASHRNTSGPLDFCHWFVHP